MIDLGFIKAISSGITPPVNTEILWYDTTVNFHKYYDTGSGTWISLASGASSWSTVLGAGAESLGQSPIISPGDQMLFEQGGFQAALETSALSANRTLQLPDKSGTLATMSDIANAGDLAAVLTLGNTTQGKDISMSSGDIIRAQSGTAYLNLRDGGDNIATLLTDELINLIAKEHVIVSAGQSVQLGVLGGVPVHLLGVGLGVNETTPTTRLHVRIKAEIPGTTQPETFMVTDGAKKLHIGAHDQATPLPDYMYIRTWASHLAIDASGGVAFGSLGTVKPGDLGLTMTVGNPTSGSAKMGLISPGQSDASYQAFIDKGSGVELVTEFGYDVQENTIIKNYQGGYISLGVDYGLGSPTEVLRVSESGSGAVYFAREFDVRNPGIPVTSSSSGIITSAEIDGRTLKVLDYDNTPDIEGIEGFRSGRVLYLTNNGTTITLKHNFPTTTPEKSIFCPGEVDLVISKYSSVLLSYDSAISKWRVLSVAN